MKRFLSIILVTLLCISFSACKNENDSNNTDAMNNVAQSECSEQELRLLMESNLDCYYLFYVAPLTEGGGTDSDGYTKADTSFFATYKELCDFVNNTYAEKTASYLLNSYPSAENPLYIEKNSLVYVDLDAVEETEYEVMWDDSYTIEFIESSLSRCSFKLTTEDFDGDEYVADGSAVFENGKWLLEDMVY